jgi:hypothetical protein
MTKQSGDDLEAVRALVEALQPFQRDEQERIIRWAREKLGLVVTAPEHPLSAAPSSPPRTGLPVDLRGFVAQKQPQSDTHFAATVAYYYRFEAPVAQRKETINANDLQEACRLADRHRLPNPLNTLNNAHRDGLLDRGPERGTFVINSVGENLVAIALPPTQGGGQGPARAAKKKKKKKVAGKKK